MSILNPGLCAAEQSESFNHFVEVLQNRALYLGDELAYGFLQNESLMTTDISFAQLDRHARAVAVHLLRRQLSGTRAILLYPSGIDFIIAFMGCLYAGVIAVPVYMPQGRSGHWQRLATIVKDARARIVLSTSGDFSKLNKGLSSLDALDKLEQFATDLIPVTNANNWQCPKITRNSLAFLQYTSGSTGQPKGVMVSHGNLLHNQKLMRDVFGHDEKTVLVSWLPLFHDMGLIGNVLHALYLGVPCYLMRPVTFLQQPIRWLQAISRFKGTTSFAPNFAYDLCVRRITPEQKSELDLRSWTLAVNGAEPVNATTLKNFTAYFADCGFSPTAMSPGYGLAEATLTVSCSNKNQEPHYHQVQAVALENHRLEMVSDDQKNYGSNGEQQSQPLLVSSGTIGVDQDIIIVNPDTKQCCDSHMVGEIWIQSPSVAQGFWQRPDATAETFQAYTSDTQRGPFLRTGDLGFIRGRELYITGRLKELIIIRGRNHYPQDIEKTAYQAQAQVLQQSHGAAFALEINGEERLVLVHEVKREQLRKFDSNKLFTEIQRAIVDIHEIPVYAIVLIKPATLPKTSSGKIQRGRCRDMFVAGSLSIVAEKTWQLNENVDCSVNIEFEIEDNSFLAKTERERNEILENYLSAVITSQLPINPELLPLSMEVSLNTLGLDSLRIVRLQHLLQEKFDLPELSGSSTIKSLSKSIVDVLDKKNDSKNEAVLIQSISRSAEVPLSSGQQRLWFLQQLGNPGGLYNEQVIWQLSGGVDISALEKSFTAIMQRHEILRTSFSINKNSPRQLIHEQGILDFQIHDLLAFDESEKEQQIQQIKNSEAQYSFSLTGCPLWRIRLLHLQKHQHLLVITMHHIIVDGWSQALLMGELNILYNGFCQQQEVKLPELPIQYGDYANWQQQEYQRQSFSASVDYWRRQLSDCPALLEMPTDYMRPARQSYRGSSETLIVQPALLTDLKALARECNTTLYVVLLAAFKILLYRLSGQSDIIVGSPSVDRERRETASLIGFFLNTLVLRSRFCEAAEFLDVLEDLRNTVNMAHVHQQVPFEKIVEITEPDRELSYNPVFQVFFNMLSLPNENIEFCGIHKAEMLQVESSYARFDLTLYLQEMSLGDKDSHSNEQGLQLKLVYQTALFTPGRIREMLRQYCCLLEQIVQQPQEKIDHYTLITQYAKAWLPSPSISQNKEWPGSVMDLFNRQAQNFPDKIAVKDPEVEWSYNTLAQLTWHLATSIFSQNIGTGNIIAVYGHRSASLVLSILSILKTGNAFLILDPAHPSARLITALESVRPSVLILMEAAGALSKPLLNCINNLNCRCIKLTRRIHTVDDLPDCSLEVDLPMISNEADDIACVGLTSGSTGVPKVILGRHGSLTHFLPWMTMTFNLNRNDRFSLLSGISHDPLQREIFTPLCLGAAIYIPQADDIISTNLGQWLLRYKITTVHLTPAMNKILIDNTQPLVLHELANVFFVGDQLTRQDVAQLIKIAPATDITNFYGATETQRAIAYYKLPQEFKGDKTLADSNHSYQSKTVIPIGQGMSDAQLLILNKVGQLAGIGEVGELCIRSPFLAVGYLDDPELTKDRFRKNPYTLVTNYENTEDRIYFTGDLGYYLENGQAVCKGRIDRQVKVRGFRIEPGEIEVQLKKVRLVKDALVVARQFNESDKRLVAYLVINNTEKGAITDESSLIEKLRLRIQNSLPAYMMPSAFVILEKIPLTVNAKIDIQSLPDPLEADLYKEEYIAPRNNSEKRLCKIWQKILGMKKIGIKDNFFFLGGHSLLATQLISFIRKKMDVELPLQVVFEYPTIAGLSVVLDDYRAMAILPPIRLQKRIEKLPLSYAQQRLWFINQLEHNDAQYNMFGTFELQGDFNEVIFKRVIKTIIERHEILRTRYLESEGEMYQLVNGDVRLQFISVNLYGVKQKEQLTELDKRVNMDIQSTFNLSNDVLLRVHCFKLNSDKTVLLFNMHHIVSDGWSVNILIREINKLYRAYLARQENPLPELPVQYADYAQWQRRWLRGEVLLRQLEYWKEHLDGIPTVHGLPLDEARPEQQNFVGHTHYCEINKKTTDNIRNICKDCDVTLFMFLQTAFSLFLSRYSNETDIVMGIPVAGRIHKDIASLIGFFSNTLILRSDLTDESSFKILLADNKQTILDAFSNQYIPFEMLVEELKPERNLNHNPLFQIMFALQNNENDELELPDLTIKPIQSNRTSIKFDIEMTAIETDGGLQFNWCFNVDLFHLETIQRMAGNFLTLLNSIITDSEQAINTLPLISVEEKYELLTQWDKRTYQKPDVSSVRQLIEKQVLHNPERIAVVFDNATLNYRMLNEQANQLAHYLIEKGVESNCLVGICIERSLNMVIAILAVMKAGGAYVPLDAEHPKARFQHILNDADVKYILTQESYLSDMFSADKEIICMDSFQTQSSLKNCSLENPCLHSDADAGQLAYVIYTSGTTGLPKGVAVEQKSLAIHIKNMLKEYAITNDDRILQFASINFDVSIEQLFVALCSGASSYIYNHNNISSDSFFKTIAVQQITVADLSPAYFKQLMSYGLWQELIKNGSLRLLILGGEAMDKDVFTAWKQYDLYEHCQLLNAYGPTEATITSVVCAVDESTLHHNIIGVPCCGRKAYVLDKYKQLVPLGVVGELYLGGEGLAQGYINQAELSREKFIIDPYANTYQNRLYKTGDMVRCLTNKQIEFIGRIDDQIKIRGFRIELKEIETCLLSHQQISNAALVLRHDIKRPQLIAYIVRQSKDNRLTVDTCSQIHISRCDELTDYSVISHAFKLQIQNQEALLLSLNNLPLFEDQQGRSYGMLTIAQAPYLRQYFDSLHVDAWPLYFQGSSILNQYWDRMYDYFPQLQLALLENYHSVVGIGNAVLLAWDGDIKHLPQGWDGAIQNAVCQHEQGIEPNTLVILAGVIDAEFKDRKLSHLIIESFRQLATQFTVQHLLVALRPIGKTANQELSLDQYVALKNTTGETRDPWLRLHESLGGKVLACEEKSQYIEGKLDQWGQCQWTKTGTYYLQDTLAPLHVDISQQKAHYYDPCVWVQHTLIKLKRHQQAPVLSSVEEVKKICLKQLSECPQQLFIVDQSLASCLSTATGSEWQKILSMSGIVTQESKLDGSVLRKFLKNRLPDYMIPAAFKFIDDIPLLADGRVDEKALPIVGVDDYHHENYVAPANPIETELCNIWQSVLKLDNISVTDNFFEIGGDSILSIQVVSMANRAGLQLSTRQLFAHQCIQELALKVKQAESVSIPQQASSGNMSLLPAQQQFFYEDNVDPHHFNQSVLLISKEDLSLAVLNKIVEVLYQRHDALRLRFFNKDPAWVARFQSYDPQMVKQTVGQQDLRPLTKIQQLQALEDSSRQIQESLSLADGPLFRAVLFQMDDPGNHLLLVFHHLLVDGISWRILLKDIEEAYRQISSHQTDIHLMPKTTSLQQWSEFLHTYKNSEILQKEKQYWLENLQATVPGLPVDEENVVDNRLATTEYYTFSFSQSETKALLTQCHQSYRTQINDLLLAGLLTGMHTWCGKNEFRIDLEGHGREVLNENMDLSETVGWFTSIYPVILKWNDTSSLGSAIKSVKEQLRLIPANGIGYSILRCLTRDDEILESARNNESTLLFNYLGQFHQTLEDKTAFEKADGNPEHTISQNRKRSHQLVFNSHILHGNLSFTIDYNRLQYQKKTIEQLAIIIKSALQKIIHHCQQDGIGSYTPTDFPLARLTQAQLDQWQEHYPNLINIYSSTAMQQGMLFHSLLEYGRGAYTTQLAITLEGDVDVSSYRQSWQYVVSRHDIFRTAFVAADSEQIQQLVMSEVDLPWYEEDWRDIDSVEQKKRFEQLRCDDKQQEFDFEQPPLMRIFIIRVADNEYRQLLSCHHVLTDGWSMPIIFQDVIQAYQAYLNKQLPQLPEVAVYYRYISWLQNQNRAGADYYWTTELKSLEYRTEIGIDKLPVIGNLTGPRKQSLLLTEKQTLQIQQLARRTQTTINTIIQAAWACLLQNYSGDREVVFGATVSGRPADLAGADQMVGLFINTLPVRVCINRNNTIKQLLQTIQQHSAARDEFSYLSLAEIQKLSPVGMNGEEGSILFDTLVVFENYPMDETLQTDYSDAGLKIRDVECYEQTNYALTLLVRPGFQMQMKIGYHAEQFDDQTVVQVLSHLQNILNAMMDDNNHSVSQLSLLSNEEKQQLFINWNENSGEQPVMDNVIANSIHELFQQQVNRTPEAVALQFDGQQLNYQQLNQQANQLAHYLIQQGIMSETLVGLFFDRSIDMIVGILAIIKAGGAYVPLDPANPSSRLSYILEDSAIGIVITNSGLKDQLPVNDKKSTSLKIFCLDQADNKQLLSVQKKVNPCVPSALASPDKLIYVIYTSGSTGKPKGVLLEHENVLNFLQVFNQQLDALGVKESSGWLWNVSYAFDASVKGLLALCQGRTVTIPSNTQIQDANEIINLLLDNQIQVFNGAPALVEQILDRLELCETLASTINSQINFIIGGDDINIGLWNRVVDYCETRNSRAINAYGPTETTINSTFTEISRNDEITIGKPVTGNTAFVINKLNLPMPVNAVGELHIGGKGLARGYLNQPELTAERFIDIPLSGSDKALITTRYTCVSKLYKTGDMVRWSVDGKLVFMGRNDQQVKIRGYRVELDEISKKLSELDAINEAVVIAKDENAIKKLIAYVIPAQQLLSEGDINKKSLQCRQFIDDCKLELEKKLPSYMVPAVFVPVDKFPLTISGKIDVHSLPAEEEYLQVDKQSEEDMNDIEKALCSHWQTILKLEYIGKDDNFFKIGGHSLLGMKLLAIIAKEFGITLDIRDLLSHLTIRLQAQLISERMRIAELLENVSTAELEQGEGEHSELLL